MKRILGKDIGKGLGIIGGDWGVSGMNKGEGGYRESVRVPEIRKERGLGI